MSDERHSAPSIPSALTIDDAPSPPVVHSVHCTAHRDDETAWKCFLEQLRSRGRTFARYEARGEIGRGGMGVVKRVFDLDARRELAMKIILDCDGKDSRGGSSIDDRTLGRFLEEAQVTSQLDHPGIVPVHEIGIDEAGRVYFTMKLVKGEDLKSIYDKVRAGIDGWTTVRAVSALLKVCEAMAFAHAKHVLHRDLKPSNVMVGRFGEVYVMDWGLARIVDSTPESIQSIFDSEVSQIRSARHDANEGSSSSEFATLDGDVVGTPSYMSPEQARGDREAVTASSDIYSLGAMLYHLLAGHPPYRDHSEPIGAQAITSLVLTGPPTPLAERAPTAPRALIAICEKAMARLPFERYATMNQLADDLRAFIENRVVSAYESGLLAEMRNWLKRNRIAASILIAAVLVILGISGFYLRSLVEREALAKKEAARADRNAQETAKRAREAEIAHQRVMRLSDNKRLEMLIAEWGELWPAEPAQRSAMQNWLVRARELIARRGEHVATLTDLRQNRKPLPHPLAPELESVRNRLMQSLPEERAKLERRASELAARIEREQKYDFGDDSESAWWHDTLAELVAGIDQLLQDDPYAPTLRSMTDREFVANSVARRSLEDAARAWERTVSDIAASPLYRGLKLAPQLGLVPLGADPKSQFQEFALIVSGDVPIRDRASGRLALDDNSAIVFVLLPGGPYRIGAQNDEPGAARFDPTAELSELGGRDFELAPFFVSKHEITQAQWLRAMGSNPSFYRFPNSYAGREILGTDPVEQVSYTDAQKLLRHLGSGIDLPTEMQWEYAARGGSNLRFVLADTTTGFDRFGNSADRHCKEHDGPASWTYDLTLDDGFSTHAPVGSFEPNAFGLHDMLGNVAEWCRDPSKQPFGEAVYRTGDGLLSDESTTAEFYSTRGGSFSDPSTELRVTARAEETPQERDTNLGIRLIRAIQSP